MDKEQFLKFVDQVDWRFAKSVPNWPHFYIVEEELADQTAFQAAKQFVKEFGYDGKFFDINVRYFEADGWTYWASPLAKPFESQYMLNRCKTEYTYDSLAKAGKLPSEGFRESTLSLAPVLEDPEFKSLVRDAEGSEFTVFDVLGTADYEIRHSNVLSWLLDLHANHGQGSSFLQLLWKEISGEHELPNLSFSVYSVDREGLNEDEKIDLLLRTEDRDWMIVIENKLFSPETGDQLDRYFHYIERRYSEVRHRIYFYQTPDGIAPAREEDSANWIPISYLAVKRAVSRFLEKSLPDRIRDFLAQYLEHIERNVLKSTGMIEKQRNILRRHAKTFHSLTFLLEEKSVRAQCGDEEFNLLKSILAVQHEVERELFDFTKRMMAKHGYARYSGLGHWITTELPGLKEKLIQRGLLLPKEALPIVFALCSQPNSYFVEIWLYKNKPLFSKMKGRISRLSEERPEPNRGDEHLVHVLYRRTIIHADEIIHRNLSELKEKIAAYFESDLKRDLEESVRGIGNLVDSIRSEEKPGRVGTEPAHGEQRLTRPDFE
jgi:hypothetical protein